MRTQRYKVTSVNNHDRAEPKSEDLRTEKQEH